MSKPKNTQKPQAEQQAQGQQAAQEQVQGQAQAEQKVDTEQQASQQPATDAPNGDAATAQPLDTAKEVEKGELLAQTTTTFTDGQKTVEHQVLGTEDGKRSEAEFQAIHNPTKEPVELAKVEEKPVTSVAPQEMAKQQAQGAMAIYIDRIKKDGTAGEKMVVETMEAYLAVMGTGKPLDSASIVREQTRLYTMFKNIGRRTDDFRKAVVVARFFFKENADGAFHDTRINRGHEALQLSADDRKAFYTYLQLFKIIASVNDLKDVKKSVDVSRSLTNPVIPAEVKERYVSLVN
ncbi:MAG: hypothetical protein RR877_00120 [Aurantimicrobium sp.]|uniref:hypothetical protein n=1 Tax=Aurantimicrobium sp. TaxID=1930784 RepID=UPI002FC80E5A